MQWRYAIGEDREALTKVDRQITEEEAKKMAQQHVVDGVKRVLEKILGRRKLKSSYEYEVQWVNCGECARVACGGPLGGGRWSTRRHPTHGRC